MKNNLRRQIVEDMGKLEDDLEKLTTAMDQLGTPSKASAIQRSRKARLENELRRLHLQLNDDSSPEASVVDDGDYGDDDDDDDDEDMDRVDGNSDGDEEDQDPAS